MTPQPAFAWIADHDTELTRWKCYAMTGIPATHVATITDTDGSNECWRITYRDRSKVYRIMSRSQVFRYVERRVTEMGIS